LIVANSLSSTHRYYAGGIFGGGKPETVVTTFGTGFELTGFDLGLVGMGGGSIREITLSPQLGFAGEGIRGKGPKPRDYGSLKRLDGAVDKLLERKGEGDNKLRLSVRVNWVRVDEADFGYYSDDR